MLSRYVLSHWSIIPRPVTPISAYKGVPHKATHTHTFDAMLNTYAGIPVFFSNRLHRLLNHDNRHLSILSYLTPSSSSVFSFLIIPRRVMLILVVVSFTCQIESFMAFALRFSKCFLMLSSLRFGNLALICVSCVSERDKLLRFPHNTVIRVL